jgi:mannitol-1-phosphate/altronate dehydrogenase
MSGETLRVDPEVLRTATTAFGETVDALNRIQADVPIGDAAAAVGQLLTAESCRKAQQGVAAAVTAAVESVRKYGESLDAAVRAYAGEDQSSADDIAAVDIGR